MNLARLRVHNRSSAQMFVFFFLSLISFRMLYGVPPVSSEINVAQAPISTQVHTNDYTKINNLDLSTRVVPSGPTTESSKSKPLPPYKTFKNKIIKEKSFNLAESLDLHTIKFSHVTPQLISPSQGKRFLTTHSNAPPFSTNDIFLIEPISLFVWKGSFFENECEVFY